MQRLVSALALSLVATLLLVSPALPQDRFAPVLLVNDQAITGFDLEQRAALLRLLGAPGDLVSEATNRLIDERLQVQAARAADVEASPQEVADGIAEFAGRANTTPENFVASIVSQGVSEAALRDFIEAGVLWRKYVRERLAPRVDVDAGDVDAELDRAGASGGIRVLLSEIILPARNESEAQRSEQVARQLATINGIDAFSAAARSNSASASRDAGGRIDWIALENLPPPLREQILSLSPGGVTAPFRGENAIAIFQLRALEDLPVSAPPAQTIDYAQFVAADASEARRVADQADTCDDLYGIARGLPADRLIRETRAPAQLPGDLRSELSRLDRNEVSLRLTRAGRPVVTMLCARTTEAASGQDREAVRERLLNRELVLLAENTLSALRDDAVIVNLR